MKISIDTTKDSPQEIQKAIDLLSSLVNSPSVSSVMDTPENTNSGVFNMFGENTLTEAVDEKTDDEDKPIDIVPY